MAVTAGTQASEAPPGIARASGLERFEAHTEKPVIVLTLVFLGILVAPEVMPHMDIRVRHDLLVLDWTIWGIFVIEYGTRPILALDRVHFVEHNVLDLIVVVVPPFRVLRLLRSARLIRLTRLVRLTSLVGLFTKRSHSLAARTTMWATSGLASRLNR